LAIWLDRLRDDRLPAKYLAVIFAVEVLEEILYADIAAFILVLVSEPCLKERSFAPFDVIY
jgi:hypothetical protein